MRILLILIVAFSAILSKAQETAIWKGELNLDLRPNYTFNSYKGDIFQKIVDAYDAKNTHYATSVHLQYGFSFSPETKQGRWWPGAWQGLGTSVYIFDNTHALGTPICIYVFQGAPVYRFNDRLSLYYEWNFGASFGWKPCGDISYSNLIVGSKVNAYINLGTGIKWRLNDKYAMTAGIDMTHFSNGNTSFPNPGVNMAGIRIGLQRSIGQKYDIYSGNQLGLEMDTVRSRHKLQFDLTSYGALRKRVYRGGETPILLPGRFPVIGIDFAPMWQVAKIFRVGVSADFQWDKSTDLKRHYVSGTTSDDILFTHPSFFRQVCVGVSWRAELAMPIFSINAGMGYNIIGPEETRASYQLANLKVHLTNRFFLNVGYQLLNFHRANNLMLGFGYSFR